MKIKILSIVFLLYSKFCLSQTINGKIVSNNYAVSNVEVINSNSRALSFSDAKGNFSIDAKTSDILVFVAKNYELKKIVLNHLIVNDKDLIVELELKAEELNEVVVSKIPSIKLSSNQKYQVGTLDKYGLEKSAYTPKVIGVNMGTVENGMNFIRIGKLIGSLFKKEKKSTEKSIINFKDYAKSNCNENYFLNSLNLKKDEIELFLNYCEADPKSKKVTESNNILSMMDFLFQKNIEFKKANTKE